MQHVPETFVHFFELESELLEGLVSEGVQVFAHPLSITYISIETIRSDSFMTKIIQKRTLNKNYLTSETQDIPLH